MVRFIIIVFFLVTLPLSQCLAEKTPMDKAYSLYFQGKMDEAVKIMTEEAEKNPQPNTYFFIGYAYYKMKQFDRAREYFEKAYALEPFYAPPVKKAENGN